MKMAVFDSFEARKMIKPEHEKKGGEDLEKQEALLFYAQAMAKERESYLYQQALNKAKPMLRGMTAEEKEKYVQGQSFSNALYQLKRRDKVYQALRRGEITLDFHREEFDDL